MPAPSVAGQPVKDFAYFRDKLIAIHHRELAIAEEMSRLEQGLVKELGWETCKTYVMRAGHRGLVKIGKATHVENRRKALQTGCPVILRVLRVIHFDCERAMHERFAHAWKQGEWFEFDPDMLTVTFTESLLVAAYTALGEAA